MSRMSSTDIGKMFEVAFRLKCRPVCVFGTEDIRSGAVPLGKVDRCVARAIFVLASRLGFTPFYLGKEAKEGVCGGGQGWLGMAQTPVQIEIFHLFRGSRSSMNGTAEYLKATPDLAENFFKAPGKPNRSQGS